MKYVVVLISLFFIGSCAASKKTVDHSPKPEYKSTYIDELFTKYSGDNPSASVLIIKDGKIEFAKSYGYADLKNKILASPTTNYRIASVTKQFTALAIMMLIDEGKISYDTRLTSIFPKFPSYGKDISIQHLLTHRSGLVKYNRFIDKERKRQLLDIDVLNGLYGTDSTYFEPGTKFSYSNTGYAVLSQIIEKVSGQSFPSFMKKEIFDRLGMDHSMIYEKRKTIKNRAFGYIVRDSSITAKDQNLTSAVQGDGGIYSSVMDYYKWDQALYSDILLPESKLNEAFHAYDEAGQSDQKGYGYGWKIRYHNGIKILEHGGSTTGFGSQVIRVPSENISIAVFTNRNKRGGELPNKARALLSHFSQGKFLMPFEIVVEKEINEKGIDAGLQLLNNVKHDSSNYSYSKNAHFNFAIHYINTQRLNEAHPLFDQLIEDHSEYFGGYYGKAIVLQKNGNRNEAIKYFNLVISKCTNSEQWAKDYASKMIVEIEG